MLKNEAEKQAYALESLKHSVEGWNDFAGEYDEDTDTFSGEAYKYAEAYGPSKNGHDIVIRMTPDQALRFVDMIARELD